jgi:hypothetical protein
MVPWIRRFSRNKLLLLALPQVLINLTCGLPVFIAIENPVVNSDYSENGNGTFVEFTTPADENVRYFVIMYRIIDQNQNSVITDVINKLDPDSTIYDGPAELPVGDEVPRNLKFNRLVEYSVATGPGKYDGEIPFVIDNPTPASGGDDIRFTWENKTELPLITVNTFTPSELSGVNLGRYLTLNRIDGTPDHYITSFLDDYHYLPSYTPNSTDYNPVDSDLQDMKNLFTSSTTIPSNIKILFCVMSCGADPAQPATILYSQPVYLGHLEIPFGLNPGVRD